MVRPQEHMLRVRDHRRRRIPLWSSEFRIPLWASARNSSVSVVRLPARDHPPRGAAPARGLSAVGGRAGVLLMGNTQGTGGFSRDSFSSVILPRIFSQAWRFPFPGDSSSPPAPSLPLGVFLYGAIPISRSPPAVFSCPGFHWELLRRQYSLAQDSTRRYHGGILLSRIPLGVTQPPFSCPGFH